MPNLSDHPLIQQSYDVSQAIEACGASPALTAAVIKSGELTEAISRLVHEQCLDNLTTCVPLHGLKPHEQRVVVECAQLEERLRKLSGFVSSAAFAAMDLDDQILLRNQHAAMDVLSRILRQRIARFYKPDPDEQVVLYRRMGKPSVSDPFGAQIEDVVIPLSRFDSSDAQSVPADARKFECMPRSRADAEHPQAKRI